MIAWANSSKPPKDAGAMFAVIDFS